MDLWEAPAGQPSRYAFSGTATLTRDDAGNAPTFLIAGTTESSCNQAPTTLESTPAPAGAFGQPSFSLDGSRVAYLTPVGASFGIATIGFDGTGERTLAPVYATAPSSGDESQNIRAAWQDATHVAWPRPTGSGTWSVVVASDSATPAPSTYMTCSGSTPHHIALLSDGSVVAAYAPTSGASADIFVLEPDATGACHVDHQLTSHAGANSRAHDFDVSPDESTIAYLDYDASQFGGAAATGNEGYLYVVPVDGSAVASPVGATPMLGRIGPRWIAAGTRLAWTRAGVAADGGDTREADDVNVVLPDGGAALDIVSGDGVNVVVGAVGPGGSCSVGSARSSGVTGALALAFMALGAARRRRARA
jgi:MYXO-CTERM domain-containing protein